MVRVLAVSDTVEEGLLADLVPVSGTKLIFACGDLPFDYLDYLMNALDVPLVFVPGADRGRRLGETIVRNVTGRHLLDIEPGAGVSAWSLIGQRHAR